jgi:hypothetical protein
MRSSLEAFIEAAREFCALSEREDDFDLPNSLLVQDVLLRLGYHVVAVEKA